MGEVSETLKYLVLKSLAGKQDVLAALIEYVNGTLSPSEAHKFNITREQLRAFWLRIRMKTADERLAKYIVIKCAPVVMLNVVPIVSSINGRVWCNICNKYLNNFPEDHIFKRHHRELVETTRKVLAIIRNGR